MENELIPYSFEQSALAINRKPRSQDYEISVFGCSPMDLKRGVDFGVIRRKDGTPMTKNPTLFKPGAEKVAVAYGLCQNYELVSKIENFESGFFYFLVRCDLVKIVNGERYVITSSYGSGNTREKRTGTQSPFDGANSALKMAQKRALVSAALSLGCMSACFTQDIESDTEDASVYFPSKDPNDPITSRQITFFYAATGRHGMTKSEAKSFLKSHGYDSAKQIKSGDFDRLLEDLDKEDAACT